MPVHTYWIVGPGRVGLAVGSVLSSAGDLHEILVVGRRPTPPDHPLFDLPIVRYVVEASEAPAPGTAVLLTVPDRAIVEAAERIARLGPATDGCVAFHFSGAIGSAALSPLADVGYAIGSLHPLQTIADPRRGAGQLAGSFFTFEGASDARQAARGLVEAARGVLLEVEAEDKARYHAACVFASNYMVACAAVAVRLLAEAVGIDEDEARRALGPLWRGAIANLDEFGVPDALTGPVARGDLETIRRHLNVLDAGTGEVYRVLAREAVGLARAQGLPEETARALGSLLNGLEVTGGDGR